jgi:hypothetical protein
MLSNAPQQNLRGLQHRACAFRLGAEQFLEGDHIAFIGEMQAAFTRASAVYKVAPSPSI